MRRIVVLAALLAMPLDALAQGAVQQLGPVVPGHLPMWTASGKQMDAGGSPGVGLAPTNNVNAGTRPTGLGVVNSSTGFCNWSAYASDPYSTLCWGFDGSGNGLISLGAIGGATPVLKFLINGSTYEFPGSGQGNILGPVTSTINEPMVWANTAGTLAKDGLNAPILHTGTFGVVGATTLTGTLAVSSNATVGGTLGVTGATTLGSTLGVTGNATVGGTLGVTGNVTLSNDLSIGDDLSLTGSVVTVFDMAPPAATLSALNSVYFPTYSQLTGIKGLLNLSGTVSDAAGSFRDAVYVELNDSDTSVYTMSHGNIAGTFAAYGPSPGTWATSYKNIVAVNARSRAATTSAVNTGVAGILAEGVQFGTGIADNEFVARNPAPGDGGTGQSVSMAPVQAILNSEYGDSDVSHVAWNLVLSNISTRLTTGGISMTSAVGMDYGIAMNGAKVTTSAIVMPHSEAGLAGTIIDYGTANGNPAGGSYTSWDPATNTGQYQWTNSGIKIASLDSKLLQLGATADIPVHLGFGQLTPPALTSCGTSPSNTGATDSAGTVTMGTGTPTGCVITFNVAYTAAPHCVVTWQGTPLASQSYVVTNTAITLTQTATDSNKVNYVCVAQAGG